MVIPYPLMTFSCFHRCMGITIRKQKITSMKKLTSLIAGLLFYTLSLAQGPELGVLAGLNLAKAVSLESYELPAKYGTAFRVGGYARWEVSESFGVRPELMFLGRKGGSLIELPVWADYKITPAIHVALGPYAALPLKRTKSENDYRKTPVDFGLGISAGYRITERLGAAIRFQRGLVNLATAEDGVASVKFANQGFSLVVGYQLN